MPGSDFSGFPSGGRLAVISPKDETVLPGNVAITGGTLRVQSNGTSALPAVFIGLPGGAGDGLYLAAANTPAIAANGGARVSFASGCVVPSNRVFAFTNAANDVIGTQDVILTRLAAASLLIGGANSATPVSYTLTLGESSRSGTDSDVAGASGTIHPGRGTGIGTPAPLILCSHVTVASGTGAQTDSEGFRVQGVLTAPGISFFGATAVVQQAIGANVNNVGASGTTGQFDDFTNGTVYATDYAALHATVYQLTLSVAQLTVACRNYGLGV